MQLQQWWGAIQKVVQPITEGAVAVFEMTSHTVRYLRNPVLKNRLLSASDLAEILSVEMWLQ